MISPEKLRRYPLFADLDAAALREIAMISEEVKVAAGDLIYESGRASSAFLLLETGCIETYLVIEDPQKRTLPRRFYLEDVNPGELFSLSAISGSETHTTTTYASRGGRLIRIEASRLMAICEANPQLGFTLMKSIVAGVLDRLHQDRVLLAAGRRELSTPSPQF